MSIRRYIRTGRLRPAIIVLSAVCAAAAAGCRHRAVAPDYGSAYISCDQPMADILLDGRPTDEWTPARIDGIATGQHQLRLRHVNFASYNRTITIKPAELTHVHCKLSPYRIEEVAWLPVSGTVDAAFDRATGRIYAVSELGTVTVVTVAGTAFTIDTTVALGMKPQRVAVNSRANRLFCLGLDQNLVRVLAGYDLGSLRRVCQDNSAAVASLGPIEFSSDGGHLAAGDTVHARLLVYSPANGALERNVALGSQPDALSADPQGSYLYAASRAGMRFFRIDPASGAENGSVSLPVRPQGIFWDPAGRQAGVWDVDRKLVTIIDPANLSAATGYGGFGGDSLLAICWTSDPDYLYGYVIKWTNGQREGRTVTMYVPTWEVGMPLLISGSLHYLRTNDPALVVSVDDVLTLIRFDF